MKIIRSHNICTRVFVVVFLSLSFFNSHLNALPKITPSCIDELKKSLDLEKKYIQRIFNSDRGWHLKYSIVSQVFNEKEKRLEEKKVNGEIIAGLNMRYSKYENKEIFVDRRDIFTINSSDKTIMHTYSTSADLKIKDDIFIQTLQDSIFNQMISRGCNSVKVDGKDEICYAFSSDLQRCPYSKIFIYTDAVTKFVLKLNVVMNSKYPRTSNVKEYTLTILEKNDVQINTEYNNIREKFLSTSGKLKARYGAFTLIEPTQWGNKTNSTH